MTEMFVTALHCVSEKDASLSSRQSLPQMDTQTTSCTRSYQAEAYPKILRGGDFLRFPWGVAPMPALPWDLTPELPSAPSFVCPGCVPRRMTLGI